MPSPSRSFSNRMGYIPDAYGVEPTPSLAEPHTGADRSAALMCDDTLSIGMTVSAVVWRIVPMNLDPRGARWWMLLLRD
jgi:hypothetical protein